MAQVWLWVGFSCLILGMLAVDLGVLNRHSHVVSVKEAARWSIVVVMTALAFNAWIFYARGPQAGLEFTAGYLIELALSVDNIFVFLLIFRYFQVPPAFQGTIRKQWVDIAEDGSFTATLTLAELEAIEGDQQSLFGLLAADDPLARGVRTLSLSRAMDRINERFGRNAVSVGPLTGGRTDRVGLNIAFGRIPDADEFHE